MTLIHFPSAPLARCDPFGRSRTPDSRWTKRAPFAVPPLDAGAVHLWRCSLELPATDLDGLSRCLSSTEREKVSRLRFARDRDRAAASRGWLRRLLSGYLGVAAGELRLGAGPRGKPRLEAGLDARSGLRFNVSDSQAVAVYAFAKGREVGVDVERVREDFDCEEIAESFFAPSERAAVATSPSSGRPRAFFRLWTAKEAYVKARGDGLAIAPESFAIDWPAGSEPRLAQAPPGSPEGELSRWALREFEPAEGFVAVLAVERGLSDLVRFQGVLA